MPTISNYNNTEAFFFVSTIKFLTPLPASECLTDINYGGWSPCHRKLWINSLWLTCLIGGIFVYFFTIVFRREAQNYIWIDLKVEILPLTTWWRWAFLKTPVQFSSVQSLSHVWLFTTPWSAACQASLSIFNSWSSLRFTSIELVMPFSLLILCCPLILLPPIPPSIRVFSNESTLCMRWPKYWSFICSIIPSKEQPGLISFRMDWLDLLAVQGTLKSLLQHQSSKASILQRSAFFTVQLSHPYMTTGKTIALTKWHC